MRHLLCLSLLVAACVVSGPATAVTVRDDSGREVVLARPALRVVSLAPHVTELLYEIDAGDRLVAVTGYSDYPAAARALPRVGGLASLDIERLVALRPDLVIAWSSGTSPAEFDALARTGVPVFRSEPHALDDIARTMERFGALTGRDDAARAAAATFRARVAALRDTYAARPPVRVFFQVWRDPLMTVGGPQPITQAIELCGGRNVFAGLSMLSPVVDVEAVMRSDPQLVVTTSNGNDDAGARAADVATWRRWTGVSAVRHERYLFLPPATITRQSSRVLIGIERLCRTIDDVRGDAGTR